MGKQLLTQRGEASPVRAINENNGCDEVELTQIHSACSECRLPAAKSDGRRWYAVFTTPKNERSTERHLGMHQIEAFLPAYETVHIWKNRQRKTIVQPLFPTYLFVHISPPERGKVLGTPGVLQIVGTRQMALPLEDAEIDFLKTNCAMKRIQPFRELAIGEPVRIKVGALKGLKGVLVRRNDNLRFVITLEMINQQAAIEVGADNLEPA